MLFGATASTQQDSVYIFELTFTKLGQTTEQKQPRLW